MILNIINGSLRYRGPYYDGGIGMKKLFFVLLSLLAGFVIYISFNTNVEASYVHTFKQTDLYNRGKRINDVEYEFSKNETRSLTTNTDWYTDQDSNGINTKLYRVSNNEWVDRNNVGLYEDILGDGIDVPSSDSEKIYSFDPSDFSFTYTGKTLFKGSWYSNTDIQVPTKNGVETYYKVSTNQWIKGTF